MTTIDSHQHFWNPARGDYGWMPQDNEILSRRYGPDDLTPQLDAVGVDQTIIVQAAPSIEETEYMLGLADASPRVAGVVGWIDFEKPDHLHHLKRLAEHPRFLGVRPMIQDIEDDDWMLRDDVEWGYRALSDLGLCFDALGHPRHLRNFHAILKRFPDLKVVLDHCMKPTIASESTSSFETWKKGMSKIADDTNAYCKLSGLVTEAGDDISADTLRPYYNHIVNEFGPERMMWGSDWPVCRLKCEYAEWHEIANDLTTDLDDAAKARIYGETAIEFYGLKI